MMTTADGLSFPSFPAKFREAWNIACEPRLTAAANLDFFPNHDDASRKLRGLLSL